MNSSPFVHHLHFQFCDEALAFGKTLAFVLGMGEDLKLLVIPSDNCGKTLAFALSTGEDLKLIVVPPDDCGETPPFKEGRG